MPVYKKVTLLGSGSFGKAFLVIEKGGDGTKFVLKSIDMSGMDAVAREETLNEAKVFASIPPHPFIVRYRRSYMLDDQLCILMDHCAGKCRIASFWFCPRLFCSYFQLTCRQLCMHASQTVCLSLICFTLTAAVSVVSRCSGLSKFNCSGSTCLLPSGGDVHSRIQKQKKLNERFEEQQIILWLSQALLGLKHLHEHHILHRGKRPAACLICCLFPSRFSAASLPAAAPLDSQNLFPVSTLPPARYLKPQNLFLNAKGDLLIGDFGIAKVLESTNSCARTTIGTPYYFSPELCEVISTVLLLQQPLLLQRLLQQRVLHQDMLQQQKLLLQGSSAPAAEAETADVAAVAAAVAAAPAEEADTADAAAVAAAAVAVAVAAGGAAPKAAAKATPKAEAAPEAAAEAAAAAAVAAAARGGVCSVYVPAVPSVYSAELRQLVTDMLQKDPSRRPTVQQMVGLPLIQVSAPAAATRAAAAARAARSSSRRSSRHSSRLSRRRSSSRQQHQQQQEEVERVFLTVAFCDLLLLADRQPFAACWRASRATAWCTQPAEAWHQLQQPAREETAGAAPQEAVAARLAGAAAARAAAEVAEGGTAQRREQAAAEQPVTRRHDKIRRLAHSSRAAETEEDAAGCLTTGEQQVPPAPLVCKGRGELRTPAAAAVDAAALAAAAAAARQLLLFARTQLLAETALL
ncbi:hypothetical protein Efla_004970 [Eimeria flavescens]